MKTSTHLRQLLVAMAAVASFHAGADGGIDKWQMTRLFQPTAADLAREEKGSIMIYDGLRDRTVEKAFDEQFERIESMMFTRVIVTDSAGEPRRDEDTGEDMLEDDGCD